MMKFMILTIAILAHASADVSELVGGYDYHQPHSEPHVHYQPSDVHYEEHYHHDHHEPTSAYLAPEHHEHHVPISEYIPPAAPVHMDPEIVVDPVVNYLPPAHHYEPAHHDGYHYKTVRRTVYRHRQ